MQPSDAKHIPDPFAEARLEAAATPDWPHRIDYGIERVFRDMAYVEPNSLLEGLEAFHRERMAKIPPHDLYPEARPWADFVIARDQHFQQLTGLTLRQLAIHRSLGEYLAFRGTVNARPQLTEKCRVVYLPETDRGPLHIKNVDDPAIGWEPDPNPARVWREDLIIDGTGSGLHIDDEPDEIFPLPVQRMVRVYSNDVHGATDFYSRYGKFWSGANYVVHDAKGNSVAIEKTSRNFMEVFPADATGGSHVSGMVCRDPRSPQAVYVAAKRRQYLARFDQPADGPDAAFWNACDRAEAKLAAALNKPGRRTVDEIFTLFTTPWPEGLNKPGIKYHPHAKSYPEYTLVTIAQLPGEGKYYRWQRNKDCEYPKEPEVYSL